MEALEIHTTTDEEGLVSFHLPKELSNKRIKVLVLINDEDGMLRARFSQSDALDFWHVAEEDLYHDYLIKDKNGPSKI